MNNRDRTLAAARQLMNAYGADSIGTNQIAEATGISPGNIYYHFKNKEEIVRTLFGELEREFRLALTADIETPISAGRFAGFYLRSMQVSWDYRFFFGGLLQLLRKDEDLAERYRALQAWAVDNLEAIARQIWADGHMSKPKGRDGFRSVAVATWLIWSNWIRYAQISSPTHEVRSADMMDGVSQIFDVLVPYLDPAFDKAARRVLSRELAKLDL